TSSGRRATGRSAPRSAWRCCSCSRWCSCSARARSRSPDPAAAPRSRRRLHEVKLMDTMVELRAVTKRFGGFQAVDAVDLQIRAGEFITLLGPSGCGKTTLLRMISGFETPTSGSILLAGTDVTHAPPYRRDVN